MLCASFLFVTLNQLLPVISMYILFFHALHDLEELNIWNLSVKGVQTTLYHDDIIMWLLLNYIKEWYFKLASRKLKIGLWFKF